ncbi:heat-inducible transcriptional repressor HrcA [Methylophilaceae bacterium]|jgi:heat-inducible transcriptional repressor|nr:heat-inducible transcriptional repressor HrcA [Betaproteobacteria bacterium]MDA9087514.1 heat-inducible transcriptional repressor HrcA [Methylophilaceae bacterium]MCH9842622.1 heat-inducible transcriptional repressor HrcA [Betaproteobacteria bacterium]MDB9716737.1 heat-inducible transcriptional repressor HrcA [Methylophilaceae bacterium]MDC0115805.1 heat-inducible transcriptional repressor HrcA [Methylophilaceae bacterium]
MDLDSRAQSLLKTLITHHIGDGQPVGSKTLSASSDLDLSPASIRNIMKDLEDAGFVSSPHTSAGRIPTNKGYRLFVDSLVTVQSLDDIEISSLKNQLIASDNKHLISSAANTLSELTKFAGIVMIPKVKKIKYKHIEFIGLSERRVLVIIVTDDGNVQNSVLYTNHDYDKTSLTEAANYFNKEFSGYSVEEAKKRLTDDLKHIKINISDLMSSAINSATDNNDEGDNIVMSGQTRLLETEELSQNVASIRKILEVFEKKSALLKLLESSHQANGIQIFIGEESGYQALDECSVITAPYEADGEVLGILGVIGPTRMAYERVIPIVDITAKLLGNSIK